MDATRGIPFLAIEGTLLVIWVLWVLVVVVVESDVAINEEVEESDDMEDANASSVGIVIAFLIVVGTALAGGTTTSPSEGDNDRTESSVETTKPLASWLLHHVKNDWTDCFFSFVVAPLTGSAFACIWNREFPAGWLLGMEARVVATEVKHSTP